LTDGGEVEIEGFLAGIFGEALFETDSQVRGDRIELPS
jgi:hypothetical protein